MEVRAFHKPAEGAALRAIDPDGLADLPADGWIWIDYVAPDEAAILALGQRYGFDRLALEDALEDGSAPRLTDFGDYLFVILRGLDPAGGTPASHELDAFVGTRYLITLHPYSIPALEAFVAAGGETPAASEGGPDRMLARLSEALVRPYLPLLEVLDDRVDDLEDLAIRSDPGVVTEVQALRRDIVRLRRELAAQREVLFRLSREDVSTLIDPRARLRFLDAFEQLDRVTQSLEGTRLILGSVLDTYRSAVAEDTNQVMKVLTIFSAILLPLTLIAGIYGMNFDRMPELRLAWGYYAALGLMLVTATGLWLYFARRGFVGRPRLRDVPKAVGLGIYQFATAPVRNLGALVRAGDRDRPSRPG